MVEDATHTMSVDECRAGASKGAGLRVCKHENVNDEMQRRSLFFAGGTDFRRTAVPGIGPYITPFM